MKRLKQILFAFLTCNLIFLSSCLLEDFNPTEWAIDPELEFASPSMEFGPDATRQVMGIQSNYLNFKAQSNAEWCHVRAVVDSLYVVIEVDANLSETHRSTEVIVVMERGNKVLSKSFNVIQNSGNWESVGLWNVLWGQNATMLQKSIISSMLQNFIKVIPGKYKMGGQGINSTSQNYYPYLSDSSEVHQVTLNSTFFINKYEVSQKEWCVIMGNNPSHCVGDSLPVENISWEEACEFVSRLSLLTGLDFRIPTSAQWEYAARSRAAYPQYLYSGSNDYLDVSKYVSDAASPSYKTEKIGSYQPNALGLYNMSGNVAELCSDWYGPCFAEPQTDPLGPSTGILHLTRGGGFDTQPEATFTVYSRSALDTEKLQDNTSFVGLRIIVMP